MLNALEFTGERRPNDGYQEATYLPLAEGSDFLHTRRLAVLQLDAGTHLLAQPLIFHSYHLGNQR